jgi:SAM-dependent methyltransferase
MRWVQTERVSAVTESGKKYTSSRDCPQCGARCNTPLKRYSTEQWHVVRCSACDFVYLTNAPDYSHLISELAWEKQFLVDAALRKTRTPLLSWVSQITRWRLSLFSPDLAALLSRIFPPGRVMDVGCGIGRTIPDLFTPYGIEISEAQAHEANAYMTTRGGRTINAAAVDGLTEFSDAYFTGVIMRGFLEHEKQPKRVLQEVRRVLADNGAVYLRVPNYGSINRLVMGAKWCGFRHPDHVNYFTVNSLRKMTMECGFSLEFLSPLLLLTDDLIKAILRKA